MSFDDLPAQPPINPEADRYAAECLTLSRRAAESVRCELDIAYGSDYWQKLDVYLPRHRDIRDVPVLLFMHGGGWTHGLKEWCGFMAPALVDLPAIFISVSYRLLPQVAFPAPALDCIAALKWAHGRIADYGGSPRRFFVGGHSAGGQIAALMALRDDWLAEAGLPRDVVQACFCISTTFNRRMVNPDAAPDHVPKESFFEIAPESPLAFAERAHVPFLITWGDREHERLARTGRQMVQALERARCSVEWHALPDEDHFDTHLKTRDVGYLWTRRARHWMARSDLAAEKQVADEIGGAMPAR